MMKVISGPSPFPRIRVNVDMLRVEELVEVDVLVEVEWLVGVLDLLEGVAN